MLVRQIYSHYQIPHNLQKHQLRVAALSQILAENWIGEKLDITSITLCGLFHDMANIIKFNFDKPQLFKEEGKRAGYWKEVQHEYINKYGHDVHTATLKTCEEIGLSAKVLQLIENLEWDYALKMLEEKNFESCINIYSDMRIGPFGILALKERLENFKINIYAIKDLQINNRFKNLLGMEI